MGPRWLARLRRAHRWLSAAFSLCVLANFGAMALGDEQIGVLVGTLTLLPLVPLMVTGLTLLLLPARPAGEPPGA